MDRKSFTESLEFEEQRQLLDHWLDIRGRRRFPARADFDPCAVHRILIHVGLMDVVGPDRHYRYRLVGTELERRFRRALAGRLVEEAMAPDYAAYLNGVYSACVDSAAPTYVVERSTYLTDYPSFCYRLLLPMASDHETVDMILFCTISDTDERLGVARPTRAEHTTKPFRAFALRD